MDYETANWPLLLVKRAAIFRKNGVTLLVKSLSFRFQEFQLFDSMSIFFWRKKKYKVGIALSGGGARGFAHLGILKALQEKGITPDIMSGVSAGAIAGSFIAGGKSPDEALKIIKEYRFFEMSRLRFPRIGLFTLDNIRASIENEIPFKKLEELPIPLLIGVTDLLEGKIRYFSEGALSQIVQASASIPVLFNPIIIDGKPYADGGILVNQPIKPLFELCQKTILINISPVSPIKEVKNLAQMATRTFQLGVNAQDEDENKKCTLYLEPPEIVKYDFMDTKHAEDIFEIGYQYASKLDINL